MTPDVWLSIARDWGLPLAMFVAFAWAILKRKLVTGSELADMRVERDQERADRKAAQAALLEFAPANAKLAEAVTDAVETVMKQDAYTERQRGRRV